MGSISILHTCLSVLLLMGTPSASDKMPVPTVLSRADYFLYEVLPKKKAIEPEPEYKTMKALSYRDYFDRGVFAYLSNDWQNCIDDFETAIKEHRIYKKKVANCRQECDNEPIISMPLYYNISKISEIDEEQLISKDDLFELRNSLNEFDVMTRMLVKTLCLRKCFEKLSEDKRNVQDFIQNNPFLQRRPYEYLQLCYYKKNDTQKAASATLTYLIRTPHNKMMHRNMVFYAQKIENFSLEMIDDYEAKEFVQHFLYGVYSYNHENWENVIVDMETSLVLYQRDLAECRSFCEGPFDHGWFPDYVPALANHYTFVLRCKANCTREMNFIKDKYYADLFDSHYEYLQMAYYKVGKLEEACKAVTSYLFINPDSEYMNENLKYYKALNGTKPEYFKIRSEALKYKLYPANEWKMVQYIDESFRKPGDELELPKLNAITEDYELLAKAPSEEDPMNSSVIIQTETENTKLRGDTGPKETTS